MECSNLSMLRLHMRRSTIKALANSVESSRLHEGTKLELRDERTLAVECATSLEAAEAYFPSTSR